MPSARLRSAGAAGAVGVPCHASRGARVGRGSRKGRARGGRELSFEFVILIDGNEVKRGVGIAAETIRYGRCVFMFRLEASARPVTRPADSPLVQLVSSSLNPALSLSSDLRAHSTSEIITRHSCRRHIVSGHPFLSLESSAGTPRFGRSPQGIATTRGVLATTRGVLTTTRSERGSTLPPTLPSQLAGGTCLLNSELLTSTCSALCSLHSRRPHSQPPPAAACLHPPAASVPSGAVPSGAVSRWLAQDGGARDGARSVHRWWSRRTTRRSTLLTALACAESRPSLAVGSRLAVESNQYLATIEIVAAERLARGGCIL